MNNENQPRVPAGQPGGGEWTSEQSIFEKSSSKGPVKIEVDRGTAAISVAGKTIGTTGMVEKLPSPIPGVGPNAGKQFTHHAGAILLTPTEAKAVSERLARKEPSAPSPKSGEMPAYRGIYGGSQTAQVRQQGDINKFPGVR